MLNIRPGKERYMQIYILHAHNDTSAFNIFHAMSNTGKGIAKCWDGWMMRYEIEHSVRIEAEEKTVQTGIFLPDTEFAPACFIPANYDPSSEVYQGIERRDYVEIDGWPGYSWKDSVWAKTEWILILCIEGELIDVPPEGFFPEGRLEELYKWLRREKELLQEKRVRITRWSGDVAPFYARRDTTVSGTTQYTQIRAGQPMPEFDDVHGKKHRVCWSLLDRNDKGSVSVSTTGGQY